MLGNDPTQQCHQATILVLLLSTPAALFVDARSNADRLARTEHLIQNPARHAVPYSSSCLAHLTTRIQPDNFCLHFCHERHKNGGPVEGSSEPAGRDGRGRTHFRRV